MRGYFGTGCSLTGIVIGASLWYLGQQGHTLYIQTWLINNLLNTAWVRTQTSGHQTRPWPWANTWPLAKLSIPHLNTEQIILAHASKSSPNFALGHLDSSVLPGQVGNSVLYASLQTYFNFLHPLKKGDQLIVESLHDGKWYYHIAKIDKKVHKANVHLLAPTSDQRLTIISYCHSPQGENRDLRCVIIAGEAQRMAPYASL